MTTICCKMEDPYERTLWICEEAERLQRLGLYVDCVLVGDVSRELCHSAQLAASSPLLRDLLPSSRGEDGEMTVVLLPGWDKADIRQLVNLLYSGAHRYAAGEVDRVSKATSAMEVIGVTGLTVEPYQGRPEDEDQENILITAVGTVSPRELENLQTNPDKLIGLSGVAGGSCAICDKRSNKSTDSCGIVDNDLGGKGIGPTMLMGQKSLTTYSEACNSHTCCLCGQHFWSNCRSQYLNHLEEHKQLINSSFKLMQINCLEESRDYVDWKCGGCGVSQLSAIQRQELGEGAWQDLNQHRSSCLARVQDEIDRLDDAVGQNICDKCGKTFKLKIMLNKHMTNCNAVLNVAHPPKLLEISQVVSSGRPLSVLDQLSSCNWSRCPFCMLELEGGHEKGMKHLKSDPHQQLYEMLEQDMEGEQAGGEEGMFRCRSDKCLLSMNKGTYFNHKYFNCEYTARENLEMVLDRFTIGETKTMDETEGLMDIEESKYITSSKGVESETKVVDIVSHTSISPAEEVKNRSGLVGSRVRCPSGLSNNSGSTGRKYSEKCHRCLRVFTSKQQFQKKDRHICVRLEQEGGLKTQMVEKYSPTPSEKITLECILCPQNRPILNSYLDLKKHLALAHKHRFFLAELEKQNVTSFPSPCVFCEDTVLTGIEQAILHVGLDHEKLFQALKHDQKDEYRYILKRLYPEKSNKYYTPYKSKEPEKDSNIALPVRRNLNMHDKANPGKLQKEDPHYVQGGSSEPVANPSGKKKTKVKNKRPCHICVQSEKGYTSVSHLYGHMAVKHFGDYIVAQYPHPDPLPGEEVLKYPCRFPTCGQVFRSKLARVKHLGIVHKIVNQCLATPKLVEAAKKRAQAGGGVKGRSSSGWNSSISTDRGLMDATGEQQYTCGKCGQEFATRQNFKLHTCHSIMDQAESAVMNCRRDSVEEKEEGYRVTNNLDQDDNNSEKENHMDMDTVESFECAISSTSFDKSRKLERHKKCSFCGALCIDDSHIHCSSCEVCYNETLEEHYPCEASDCSKCFKSLAEREKHQSNHSWGQLF